MEKRRKIQYELAFAGETRGEALRAPDGGTESTTAKLSTESQANTDKLIEEACKKENLKEAWSKSASRRTETGYEAYRVGRRGNQPISPYPSRTRAVNLAVVR